MVIVGELEGSVMVLPPLMLKLLPEMLKVGLGTLIVAELAPLVTCAIPKGVMVCATCAGALTVKLFTPFVTVTAP